MNQVLVDVRERDGLAVRCIGSRAYVITLERSGDHDLTRQRMLPSQIPRGCDLRNVRHRVSAGESSDGAVLRELRIGVTEVECEVPLAGQQRLELRLNAH